MKDFDEWNKEKQYLEKSGHENLIFREREIWWCSLGKNIGSEQDGKNKLFERPVLVFKKFNDRLCWILPLSSRPKEGVYYHILKHGEKEFTVILSQLRLVSIKRFRRLLIGAISPHQFSLVQEKVINLIKPL